jgi:proteic killer suppression protein
VIRFRTHGTEDIFNGLSSRAARNTCPETIWKVAARKLSMIDYADHLEDLASPPGNKLEKLAGNRKGQYSIRINRQYRVCFIWTRDGAVDVEISDYH